MATGMDLSELHGKRDHYASEAARIRGSSPNPAVGITVDVIEQLAVKLESMRDLYSEILAFNGRSEDAHRT